MLLDTSFVIDLLNGDDGAVEKAHELETDLVQQRLSSMTLFEVYYGVARATDSEVERQTVEDVLASKPIHPADTAVMRKAGRLAGELQNDGAPVGDGVVIIGATAEVLEEPVVTRNHEDFEDPTSRSRPTDDCRQFGGPSPTTPTCSAGATRPASSSAANSSSRTCSSPSSPSAARSASTPS
ncbi:MAG: type II toxin-antitoxin system VapC family toxin [Haloarculaceae archaeon]